mgnify:CR=1 FL=1
MNYKIVLTPDAQNDLNDIFKYIAFDLQSFQNATSQLDRIEKAVKSLEQLPSRFRLCDKEPWKSRNLRVMPVDNYIVLYIVDNNKNIVTVVHIMYGGRNIEFLLEG